MNTNPSNSFRSQNLQYSTYNAPFRRTVVRKRGIVSVSKKPFKTWHFLTGVPRQSRNRRGMFSQTNGVGFAGFGGGQNFDLQPTNGIQGIRDSWCSTMIVNETCVPEYPGQELRCYKELWTVDGAESKLKKSYLIRLNSRFLLPQQISGQARLCKARSQVQWNRM